MEDSRYSLTVGLGVLAPIGRNLYSNISAVLSEMIANAWDADATEVNVKIDLMSEKIIIKDNGFGMSAEDINNKYLHVGYQKREAGIKTTPSGRHVMGRKGIGKVAVFSFAESIEVISAHKENKSGCIIKWQEIENAIQNNISYNPTSISENTIKIEKGTQISLGIRPERIDLFHEIESQ